MEQIITIIKDATIPGVMMMLAVIIFYLIKSKAKMNQITDNHLHAMPQIETNINEIKIGIGEVLKTQNEHGNRLTALETKVGLLVDKKI